MLALVAGLRGHVKTRGPDHVAVDSQLSPLHHTATALLLLTSCLLVCVRQYFGQPVQCLLDVMGDDIAVQEHVLNTYCFVSTTYTVTLDEVSARQQQQPHVGVGPAWWRGQQLPVKRHAYYQWVPLVLFLQFLLFRAPYQAWKQWEGGLVRASLCGLAGPGVLLLEPGQRGQLLRRLAVYFAARLHTHRLWAAGFLACDILQLVNVAANILLTDTLLGGAFLGYGVQVVKFLQLHPEDGRYDKIDAIFPKVTKCTFTKFGPSGSLQNHEALCVMGLNVVNEKIYTALWFWLLLVLVASSASLLWRLVEMAALHWQPRGPVVRWAVGLPAVVSRAPLCPAMSRLDLGDWLYLHLLVRNMDPSLYAEFLDHLLAALDPTASLDGEATAILGDG